MSNMDMGLRPNPVGGNNGCNNESDLNELKTQFMTREGIYRLMTLSDYSRPNRVQGYANSAQGSGGGVPAPGPGGGAGKVNV